MGWAGSADLEVRGVFFEGVGQGFPGEVEEGGLAHEAAGFVVHVAEHHGDVAEMAGSVGEKGSCGRERPSVTGP